MTDRKPQAAFWLVLLAAAGTFAITMGTRQTMGLFLSPLNTATGLGVASISLAFAFGQLWWGLTQPFAGAFADRVGAGRVLLLGVSLVALGTFLTPYMTSTWGLILALGILAAGGATWRLREIVGGTLGRERLLTMRSLDADEAHAAGLDLGTDVAVGEQHVPTVVGRPKGRVPRRCQAGLC